MTTARKRGKTWQYEIPYTDEFGKHQKARKGGFRTKPEAMAAALELETELKKGYNPRKKEMLLSDYYMQWAEIYKKPAVSELTYRRYVSMYNTIKKLFPYTTLASLTREEYQKALNKFAETHVKESTKRVHIHIKGCIQNALDDKLIIKDPTKRVVISGKKKSKHVDDKYLNYKDFLTVMNCEANSWSHYIILIACYTGARYSEILGLTWDNVDRKKKTLRIEKTWLYKLDKPDFGPTKNHETRTIAINDELIRLFDNIPIINDRIIGVSITPNAVNKSLKLFLTKNNITPLITIHGLRHSHASALLYKGINIMSISKRLGHKDLSVTMETYSHMVKELEEEDNQKIINILKKGTSEN